MSEVAQETTEAAAMDNANAVTYSTTTGEEPLFYGRWKAEEERYAEMIIQEFRAGNLDIEEGTTLRGYLANVLNCAPKRISKKFESSGYNGRQQYIRKPANFNPEESKKRLDDLEVARQEFETRRKGLAKKPKRGTAKSSSPKATAFLKKKTTGGADRKPSPLTAQGRDAAAPPQPHLTSNLMGQTSFNSRGTGGFSFLAGGSALGGLPNPGLDTLMGGAMYPGRMNYADALLLSRSNPALGLSPSLGPSSFFGANRAGLAGSINRPSSDAALLETMLRNSTAGSSLAGYPSSRDILSAEIMMQRRIDAAQMARHDFEQRFLVQQLTDQQRKRALEEGNRGGDKDPQEDASQASKRARQDDV